MELEPSRHHWDRLMTLTEIVLTLVLGAVGGLISFEIWGWLPIVTRVLDGARRKVVLDEDSSDASERFNERRVTGVAWLAMQLSVALLRQVHARPRHLARSLDMAAYGSTLGGVFAIVFFASSLLVDGAPIHFRMAVEQVGSLGAMGGLLGYVTSISFGAIRGK
jgi:hypothetical protein